MYQLSESVSR